MRHIILLGLVTLLNLNILMAQEYWVLEASGSRTGSAAPDCSFGIDIYSESTVSVGLTEAVFQSTVRGLVYIPDYADDPTNEVYMVIYGCYDFNTSFLEVARGTIADGCIYFIYNGVNSYGDTYRLEAVFYRLNSLKLTEIECGRLSVSHSLCYEVPGFVTPFSYSIQDSLGHVRNLTSLPSEINANVMRTWFGANYVPSYRYVIYAQDWFDDLDPVYFRVNSAKPSITYEIFPSICDSLGGFKITNITLDPEIEEVSISALQSPSGPGIYQISGTPTELIGQRLFVDSPGNHLLAAENINLNDLNDACITNYGTLNVPDDKYTLSLSQSVSPEKCFGDNAGSITVTALNGLAAYQYAWTKNGSSTTYPNINTISGLEGNQTYNVTVKDHYGCPGTLSNILVGRPAAIDIPLAYVSSNGGDGVSCHPSSIAGPSDDGVLVVNATGGTGTLQYSLDGVSNDRPFQNSATFNGLPSDTYSVIVRDAVSPTPCQAVYSSPVVMGAPSPVTYSSIEKTDIECSGSGLSEGTITVNGASGGTTGYSYSIDSFNPADFQPEDIFRFVAEGNHTVYIMDGNDCVFEAEEVIINSEAMAVNLVSSTSLTCSDDKNGTATIEVVGGQPPLNIAWDNGGTSLTATGLTGGDHTVTVSDANGCEGTSNITIGSPPPLVVNEIQTPPTCADDSDGSIVVSASGGNGNYSYVWTDGPSGETRTNLPIGIYSVVVADQLGCDDTTNIELLPPPGAELGADRNICPGQPVVLIANIPGTYTWTSTTGFASSDPQVEVSDEGTYTLTVVDGNNCITQDDIVLTVSSDLLNADFLIIPEAYEGDTIVVIDISWPLPDDIFWTFPPEAIIVNADGAYAEVRFDVAGTYDITLSSTLGGCVDDYVDQVTILSGPRPPTGGRLDQGEDVFKRIAISPNPTTGNFGVEVLLREEMNVELRVFTSDGGKLLLQDEKEGATGYAWHVDIGEDASGLYFVALRAGSKVRVVRVIKY